MENKKDIGKAFREKLDGLERSPSDAVWNSISADLRKKEPKKAFWFRRTVIALLIIILALGGTFPLWKEHVPHVYMEMPHENGSNTDNGQPLKQGMQPGKGTVVNKNHENGINDPETESQEDKDQNSSIITNQESYAKETFQKKNNNTGRSQKLQNTNAVTGITTQNDNHGQGDVGILPLEKDHRAKQAGEKYKNQKAGNTTGQHRNSPEGKSKSGIKEVVVNDTESDREQRVWTGVSESGNVVTQNNKVNPTANQQETMTGDEQNDTTGLSSGIEATNSRTKKTDSENNSAALPEDDGRGVFKTLDLSQFSYGADSLPSKRGENKKIDFSTVADSLNKLYGRDVKKTDDKKNVTEQAISILKDTTPYKQLYVYAFYVVNEFQPPSNGGYFGGSVASSARTDVEKSSGYGAYAGMRVSNKLGLRIGFIKSSLELSTSNVALQNTYIARPIDDTHPEPWVQTVNPRNFSNVSYAPDVTNNILRQELATGTDNNGQETATVNFKHKVSFFEVPIDVTYRLKEGVFGITAIGGISMRQLKENSITAENSNGSIYIGRHKMLEKTTFTTNAGINLSYEILNGLQVNAEPSVRYAFSKEQFIDPVTFMVQFGLQYNFNLHGNKK